MSRWTEYRNRRQQKRNAFVLLTLSGAIRSADVEIPYLRELRVEKQTTRKLDAVLAPQVKQSICSMDLKDLFSKGNSQRRGERAA
jgi:hypothetical protein